MTEPKVIATIKGKDLPGAVKNKAIAEARLIAKADIASFWDTADISLFVTWEETPSGSDFWSGIYRANDKERRG